MIGPVDGTALRSVEDDRSGSYGVAICTYRGARYLREQLDSILASDPSFSELILVDDASPDDTARLARDLLADRAGAQLVLNPQNRGSARSFESALAATTAPIVFLADQDDVWHPDKVRRTLAAFRDRPGLLMVHSDARIVESDGTATGYTLFDAIEFSPREKAMIRAARPFDTFVRRNVATGATMALRRSLLEAALPLPDEWVHDEWLATIAAAIGEVDFIDEALIDYRQHGGNQIGARRLDPVTKVRAALEQTHEWYERQVRRTVALSDRLVALGPRVADEHVLRVREKLAHLRRRATLPRNRLARTGPILREWFGGGYARYSTGFKSIARDFLHRA
jgi:glycosyltransferase involved in cell wall biosynthesis